MKRILTTALVGVAGTFAVAAVTPVRELPDAVAGWNATADRSAALDALASLVDSQRAATDDLVARLADGRLSLAEAVDTLENNTRDHGVFLGQLALGRPEATDRERLTGFLVERAKDRVGSDPGQQSALLARLGVDGK